MLIKTLSLVLIVLGYWFALQMVADHLSQSLIVLGPMILVAFLGSYFIVFAGFTKRERVYKWMMTYLPFFLFGIFARAVENASGWMGLIIFACVFALHIAYYWNSMQSRERLLRSYWSSMTTQLPYTSMVIHRLILRQMEDVAVDLVRIVSFSLPLDKNVHADITAHLTSEEVSGINTELNRVKAQLHSVEL